MATFSNEEFTGLRGVNLSNTAFIRTKAGTNVAYYTQKELDADKTIYFPAKSGTIGVSGTFAVQVPALTAGVAYGTNVTVSGIRAEDGVVCSIQGMTSTGLSERGYPTILGVDAGNGGVNLTLGNPFNTSTAYYKELVIAYTAVR